MTRSFVTAMVAAVMLGCSSASAQLTIIPHYSSTISGDPNFSTIQSTIGDVVQFYQTNFSTPITVNITFQSVSTGLGSSSTAFGSVPYATFRTALALKGTTANDASAIASLPIQVNNPVNSTGQVDLTTPNGRALGLPGFTSASDSTISLNIGVMNLSRSGTPNPSKYDLYAVAAHEINEALGFGSNLDFGSSLAGGNVTPFDLFRYDNAGNRSFTASQSAQSYLSINGGVTKLVRFNQDPSGDRGDWHGEAGPRIQNAFGTPGVTIDFLSEELTALDVIGYTPVPEPTLLLGVAAGGLVVGGVRRSRRRARSAVVAN